MATLTTYFEYDVRDLDINFFKNTYSSEYFINFPVDFPEEEADYDHRYSIFSAEDEVTEDVAMVWHGNGFGYGGEIVMSVGNVEAWGESTFNGLTWDVAYLYEGITGDMGDFFDAYMTNPTTDDFAVLEGLLSGDDTFNLGDFDDRAEGYGGADTMTGGGGEDRLFGGAGDDDLRGGNNNDRLYGGADNDELRGENGNDKLIGGTGNDDLFGGANDDKLKGQEGTDFLRGGSGTDKLFGGDDADTFKFNTGDDLDIIKDFNKSEGDVIDLSECVAITDFTDLETNHMSQSANGNHVVIDAGGGDMISIRFTLLGDLDSGDFVFVV